MIGALTAAQETGYLRLRERVVKKFTVIKFIRACLAYWMTPSAAWRYWRLNDPFYSDAAATGVAKIVIAFE